MPLTNPILRGFYPDPSICRVGEDYYLVTSSFEFFPGVPIFHSRDLANWRQIGHCLTRPSQLPLADAKPSMGIWAPTIRHHDGKFYMVTTNMSLGGNFIVTATDPAGEWSEPILLDQEGIDPSLFFDNDGKVYLTTSENRQSEIDLKTGKRLTEVRRVWEGTRGGWTEAPHLYKLNEYYYLIIAEGGTGPRHHANIARSKSPWGPFEPCPRNPILTNRGCSGYPLQCTGHGDLTQDQNGNWWMVFLGVREISGAFPRVHNLGRETCLAPVEWDSDGWPVVNGNGTASLEIETEHLLPARPWPQDSPRDDFNTLSLRFCWNTLRNLPPGALSLAERPGWLRINGRAVSLDEPASPACVLRRQQDHHCEVSAFVDYEPQTETGHAGLTVYANHLHHYDIIIQRAEGRRCVALRRRIGDMQLIQAREPLTAGPVTLGITADTANYTFWYRQEGSDRHTLGTGMTRYLCTEVAGGFTGVYFGMFAICMREENHADFDWFEYTPLPQA